MGIMVYWNGKTVALFRFYKIFTYEPLDKTPPLCYNT